jgi:lycopene cyclase domain-containing protein
MSLYAWLMIGSLAGPLLLSFDKKVGFYKWWPALFAGILVNGFFFILWDSWFTSEGIWSFNPSYVAPQRWLLLPIEEWSFFVVIPYCSVFIYACCKAYLKDDYFKKLVSIFNIGRRN